MVKSKAKYKLIRDSILQDIRNGKYQPRMKFATERQLAQEAGVSYMTVRQAITELVEANILVRRNRTGIFLSRDAEARIGKDVIHFICGGDESPQNREFMRVAQQQARQYGYSHHMVLGNPSQIQSILRLLSLGEPCVLFCCGTFMSEQLMEAIQKARHTVVSVGTDLTALGVRSVLYNDHVAAGLLMDLLKAKGHNKIAFVANNLDDPNEQLKIRIWKSSFGDQDPVTLERRLIVAPPPVFECASSRVYEAVVKYLKSNQADATAFICLFDESCVGAMAACRTCGYRVPEDISFVCFNGTSILRFSAPPVTVTDPDIPASIKVAIQMIDKSSLEELSFIVPKIIEGQSVKAIRI